MTSRDDGISPQLYARAGGVLYLFIFALGWLLLAWPHLTPAGDASATARSIVASHSRLYVYSGLEVFLFSLDVPLAVIFYVLLKPVSPGISLLSALFRFGEALLGSIVVLNRIAVLVLYGNAGYAAVFSQNQLQALASLFLKLHDRGVDIALVLFGIHLIILGYLMYRSGYLPKVLGVLLAIAGICYVVNSYADIAAPAIGAKIPLVILLPAFIGEVGLALWLLIKGVDVEKWEAKVRR